MIFSIGAYNEYIDDLRFRYEDAEAKKGRTGTRTQVIGRL